jgi:hypothetical protein
VESRYHTTSFIEPTIHEYKAMASMDRLYIWSMMEHELYLLVYSMAHGYTIDPLH